MKISREEERESGMIPPRFNALGSEKGEEINAIFDFSRQWMFSHVDVTGVYEFIRSRDVLGVALGVAIAHWLQNRTTNAGSRTWRVLLEVEAVGRAVISISAYCRRYRTQPCTRPGHRRRQGLKIETIKRDWN
nr:hypothetical protein CFP56_07517 [Quercus suber]